MLNLSVWERILSGYCRNCVRELTELCPDVFRTLSQIDQNTQFMVDIEIQGDVVKVVKEYGDGVSSESTYEEMPPRYRFKASNYDSGRCYKLQKG